MSSPSAPTPHPPPWRERLDPLVQRFLRSFHRYASWLVSISWRRFVFLALALIILSALVQSLPIFRYTVTEWVEEPVQVPELPDLPEPPAPPPPAKPASPAKQPSAATAAPAGPETASTAVPVPLSPASGAASAAPAPRNADNRTITIELPNSATREIVQAAIDEARRAAQDAVEAHREAQRAVEQAQREADLAARDAQTAARDALREARRALREAGLSGATRRVQKTRTVHWGDFLTDLALIWVLASVVIKATYKGRLQAEVKAAQATETAEAESLKRQVVEARMAAMQAQVEPHFLFNTLASIDHLIEVDPPRASQMQKNLIALLRASMPTMRETQDSAAPRDLQRELAVIRPYLEILKVRMEERLATEIDVPEGLMSAQFPPMMIQTLVENAIKHGLEPKPEGGRLTLKAEIVHGKLAVSVTDTGLGFGRAPTAGTGVGLANIRERLQLIYGTKALLAVAENPGGGTRVTITVPYRSLDSDAP
jgi:hypothetical protein